jgi:hypothetical protein
VPGIDLVFRHDNVVRWHVDAGRPLTIDVPPRHTQVRESMIQLTVGELPGTVLRTHPHGGPGERTHRKALAKPTQRCHARPHLFDAISARKGT